MNKTNYENLNETIYHEKLENGLNIYVLHKEGFQKTYATFTTKYGSIDSSFQVNGEVYHVPDGIAHFLEHKMFEEKEIDVFQTFASFGGQTNAFTTFNRTTYLFSSTAHVMKNLETLIDFVQRPYFIEENVAKEKGIIGQEIRMYDDNPDWQLYFGLLRALYKNNPINIDIAGTVESIDKITREELYLCYETFYHPSNMILFVSTGINPEEIIAFIKENQAKKTFSPIPSIIRNNPKETAGVHLNRGEISLPVSISKVLMGFKDIEIGLNNEAFITREVATQILLEMVLGQGSSIYETMINEGIIDEDFSYEYQIEQEYAFSLFGGDTNKPELLIEKLLAELTKVKETNLEEADFLRIKKKKIGDYLRKLNSPEYIANQFTRYIYNHANLFQRLEIMEKIDFNDIIARMNHFDLDNMAISIVHPLKG